MGHVDAQGHPTQNWNTQGTHLADRAADGSLDFTSYGNTMTGALHDNHVNATVQPNVAAPGAAPSMAGLANNIDHAGGQRCIIQTTFVDGSGHTQTHTVTARAQGGDVVVSNLTGHGGETTVPRATFMNGQVTSAGGTVYTVQPIVPAIVPDH
jgi:hypothetical protein